MEQDLRLLILEDVAAEAELTVRALETAGLDCAWRRVDSETDFRAGLRELQPDIVLSDFTLPRFDGMSALAIAAAEAPEIPFIFVSGTIGEERAIEALKHGAIDYVLKSNLERLAPAVKRALAEAISQRARHQAEERVTRLTRVSCRCFRESTPRWSAFATARSCSTRPVGSRMRSVTTSARSWC